jgi:hypothetical protein
MSGLLAFYLKIRARAAVLGRLVALPTMPRGRVALPLGMWSSWHRGCPRGTSLHRHPGLGGAVLAVYLSGGTTGTRFDRLVQHAGINSALPSPFPRA